MRNAYVFGILLTIVLAVPSPPVHAEATAEPTGTVEEQLLEELRLLRAEIARLGERIEQMEAGGEADETAAAEARQVPWDGGWRENKADPAVLAEIDEELDAKIAEGLTEADALAVVQRLDAASAGQNSFSPTDPQVMILAKLGREHPPVLIDAMQMHGIRYYAENAINTVDWTPHRQLVLDSLALAPDLVKVVARRGWIDDAKPTLVEELRHRNDLPIEWLRVAASVAEPGDHDALAAYLVNVNSWQLNDAYNTIRRVDGLDIDTAVGEAWEASRFDAMDDRQAIAVIAVGHGYEGALIDLIELLPDEQPKPDDPHVFMRREVSPRLALLRHTEASGTNAEIKAWYRANRDNLVFDVEDRKWRADRPEAM